MTEKKELKLCPFCGGEAKIGKGQIEFWAYCPHCGAQTEFYETEREAAEAWNTRPIEDDLNEQIGRFKKYAEALENEIKELREALTFYAKGEHLGLEDWQIEQILKDDDVFAESYVETGKKAREALKVKEK